MTPDEVRQSSTDQIIDALQSDLPPWRQPWSCDPNAGQPTNLTSKKPYRGINPLVLQCTAVKKGFRSKWWATFNQWREADCHVQ